jgi:hypothetical protein
MPAPSVPSRLFATWPRPVVGAVILTLGLGLGAAQAATAQGSPADPVEAMLDAIVAKDFDAVADQVCAEKRDQVVAALDIAARFGAMMPGIDVQTLIDGMTLEIADRAVGVVEQEAERATVSIAGSLIIGLSDDAARTMARSFLESLGQQVTEEMVEGLALQIQESLGEEGATDLTDEVETRLESGRWVMCDDFGAGGPAGDGVEGDLCDVITVEELNGLGALTFTEASGYIDGCTYVADEASGFGSLDVRLDALTASEWDFPNAGYQSVDVAGRAGYIVDEVTLAVDLDGTPDGRVLVLDLYDSGSAGIDAAAFRGQVAAIVVPRLLERAP